MQIFFDCIQEKLGVINLLGNLFFRYYKEIVIITIVSRIGEDGDYFRKLNVEDSCFNVKASELSYDAAMVFHINFIISEYCAHRMEHGVVSSVCRALVVLTL